MATHFPREMITSDNHSPIVNILTWILLVSVVLSVGAKLAIKTTACHSFDTDDAVLTAAMVLSAAQSVARSIQTYNGVGRHSESLKTSQVTSYEKAGYSADVLYIISLAVSKISILVLLWQITPSAIDRRLIVSLGGFIALWTSVSFLAAIFQCKLPDPWMILDPHCFDRVSFWTSYGVINIFTEVTVISLPAYIIWRLQMSTQQKLAIIACFATRLMVIGAAIAQLTLLHQHRKSQDITFDMWSYYLATQFVQSLSVITACVPYIKNLLLGVESGMFQTGHFEFSTLRKDSRNLKERSGKTATSRTLTRVGDQKNCCEQSAEASGLTRLERV